MKQRELKKLIQSDSIHHIVLARSKSLPDLGWEIWAYDFEGSITCKSFDNMLMTSTNEPKYYGSLDRAYSALRKLGFKRYMEIDG